MNRNQTKISKNPKPRFLKFLGTDRFLFFRNRISLKTKKLNQRAECLSFPLLQISHPSSEEDYLGSFSYKSTQQLISAQKSNCFRTPGSRFYYACVRASLRASRFYYACMQLCCGIDSVVDACMQLTLEFDGSSFFSTCN